MKKKRSLAQVSNGQENQDEEFLSNWMSELPKEKKDLPLSHLAIPGSHDSFTYSLCKTFPVGPGKFSIRLKLFIFPL